MLGKGIPCSSRRTKKGDFIAADEQNIEKLKYGAAGRAGSVAASTFSYLFSPFVKVFTFFLPISKNPLTEHLFLWYNLNIKDIAFLNFLTSVFFKITAYG